MPSLQTTRQQKTAPVSLFAEQFSQLFAVRFESKKEKTACRRARRRPKTERRIIVTADHCHGASPFLCQTKNVISEITKPKSVAGNKDVLAESSPS